MKKKIIDYINTVLRPMVKADGGDIECKDIVECKMTVHAYGDCATCNGCGGNMAWWINKKIQSEFGVNFDISIIKKIPYFNK